MSLVFSDNFDDNDVTDWTRISGPTPPISASSGKCDLNLDQERRAKINLGGNYSSIWCSYDSVWTSITTGDGDYTTPHTGPGATYSNYVLISVGLIGSGGQCCLRTMYNNFDEGTFHNTESAYPIVSGTSYKIIMFVQEATNATSNDGVCKWWIDGGAYNHSLIREFTTADNWTNADIVTAQIGAIPYSMNPVQTIDNYKFGTTEADVWSGGNRNPVPMGFVLE